VVARLLAQSRRGYDLVSIMANLRCQSPAELLLIPAFVYFFFKLYPPDWVERRKGTAAAAGGCMFIRRDTLSKLGGIESYRDQLIDDCALARRVKAVGGRVWLGVSHGGVISTRGYNEASVIRRMIARSAFTQLNHSAILLLGAILGMAATYLLPVALLFAPDLWVIATGATVLLLSFIMFQPALREFGAPVWPALFLPGIAAYYLLATVESAVNYWSGKGGEWKGRVQDAK
jgi:hopene-associated glycosyltransferase HpnB